MTDIKSLKYGLKFGVTFEFELWQFYIICKIYGWCRPIEIDILHIVREGLNLNRAHLGRL